MLYSKKRGIRDLPNQNNTFNEYNFSPSENNKCDYENEKLKNYNFETNKSFPKTDVKHNIKRRKILFSFVFLLASFAIIQSSIYIPVFSDIFSPKQEVAVLTPTYAFSSVSTTKNQVSCTLNIENVDFEKTNYYLCLTKEEDATDEFVSIILASAKENFINVKTNNTDKTFSSCLAVSGVEKIKYNTNYALLLIKDDKIILKQVVTTQNFVYITNIEIKPTTTDKIYRYLNLRVTPNEEFKNFNSLYFQIVDKETNMPLSDYAIIPKEYLSESFASLPFKLGTPKKDYILKIYCSTDSPDNIEYTDEFVKDEIKYYLIYTHNEIINF